MTMTRTGAWLVALTCTLLAGGCAPANGAQGATPMLGFSTSAAAKEQALEQRFDQQVDPAQLRKWLKRLTSAPNQYGSPHDKANAEFILKKFKQWGWDAHIEKFSVLIPTPKKVSLEMVAPTTYTAKLHEPPVAGDPTSKMQGVLPPYNVYGADGDVTAELVYVNYGLPDDYKALARRGIDVKGKIVIARYGHGWRGLKPLLAQRHGAVGCIIYSDPRDDGYFQGDVYPEGGWKPPQGVQRGSVRNEAYQGDPLTPGWGSTPDAKRLPLSEAKGVLDIPVLPISYADATPLLKALGGPVAPENWRGALPFTYHIGAGPTKVHLVVKQNWDQQPVYDVIAKLEGSVWPDQWVMRGVHHDAWTFGAYDPLAGTVAMMAEAKAMGHLYKQGWRPKRTLVYASWDAEEPGTLGSIEWAETHAKELKDKAVLYVNCDTLARGFLRGEGASPSVAHLISEVAADVTDPETGVSVLKRARAHMLVTGFADDASPWAKKRAKRAAKGGDLPIGALGAGSDYGVFVDHLGITAMDVRFGGEDADSGIYHSRYDSFAHYVRSGDPGFKYVAAEAKVVGRIIMRTANARVLPFQLGNFSTTFDRYVKQLHTLVEDTRKATKQQHHLMEMNAFKLVVDPRHPVAPPKRLSDMPKINLAPLDKAAATLAKSAKAYRAAYAKRAADDFRMPDARLTKVNDLMGSIAQTLTDKRGLPGRKWYRNMMYAPGSLTGYSVKTVPGVRESIEARDWKVANQYAKITAGVIDQYRAQLDQLTALLKK
ncbi:MAG TPA: transferrin receptor-like dimerization domain-containing protein [Oleiagrimonas sp.]|nr:transferrin receptor-like dimerization domain-containing protein [Oleiagrimonas sp.]